VKERKFETLTLRSEGHFRLMDLEDRPENESALSQLSADVAEACEQLAWDEEARAVVLAFPGEMKASSSERSGNATERVSLVEPVARLKQPVIGAIRGNVLDLGLELALACDIRIVEEGMRLGFPCIAGGRMPADGGTQRLPRLIGRSRAIGMILTGETVDAREACRIGLAHRAVSPDSLMRVAREAAGEMAEKSPLSLSYAKEALYSGLDLTLDQGLDKELDLYLLLYSTSDRTEGITAFRDKRKPDFKGI
jgi:enoyl-CoA hydratase